MSSSSVKNLYGRIMPSSKKQINDKVKELGKKFEDKTKNIEAKIDLLEKHLEDNDGQINNITFALNELKASVASLEKEIPESSRKLEKQVDEAFLKLNDELKALILKSVTDSTNKILQSSEMISLQKEVKTVNSELSSLKQQVKWINESQERKSQKIGTETIDELKKFINQELKRRDTWAGRAAEIRRLSGESPVWVIKCPAPEDDTKVRWGDYSFALTLKRELEKKGVYALVDTREDWGCETGADVVLVLRGCLSYRPDRRNDKCLYIMWNISHPDMVTKDEYQLYDVVCVGSYHYAAELKDKLSIPVIPLLQCTDTDLFFPPKEPPAFFERDYIFIGNSRGVARNCVMWAIEDQLPLRMWGSGWDSILRDHMDIIEAPYIENSRIPELYRTSKVALNDHWDDMREKQFINNRIFDVLACGLPVITDTCQELKELFPDAVLHYKTKEDFDECVRRIEHDYTKIRLKVEKQWPMIQREYSFRTRAKQLIEIAKQYRKK